MWKGQVASLFKFYKFHADFGHAQSCPHARCHGPLFCFQSFRAYVDDINFKKQDWLESEKLFRQVVEVNIRYLGSYAKYHILWQLAASFYYSYSPVKYQAKHSEKMSLKFLVGGSENQLKNSCVPENANINEPISLMFGI
ncbi:hypothetical protein BGZ49_010202 [Haplosporangium sp. Z 27]|nr:hypothetical protein BGZ49_010202 [Haplosporangium sp. Z 27]